MAQYQPAVMRGLVRAWPVVQLALRSTEAFLGHLAALDNGTPVDSLLLHPEEDGRIFYNAAMDGFNFARVKVPLSTVLEQLDRYSHFPKPPSVAVQSALISGCLPGLLPQIPMPLLEATVQPRIWIGNHIVTPAHFDESSNIACVIAGRRRFTLFPPGQVENLYIGPLDFAPTGTPISRVSFRQPDFDRFPRFRVALENAWTAELEPGDAIYIPPLWWHHVESLEACNALVNYWWGGVRVSPTPEQRAAWDFILRAFAAKEQEDHDPQVQRVPR